MLRDLGSPSPCSSLEGPIMQTPTGGHIRRIVRAGSNEVGEGGGEAGGGGAG